MVVLQPMLHCVSLKDAASLGINIFFDSENKVSQNLTIYMQFFCVLIIPDFWGMCVFPSKSWCKNFHLESSPCSQSNAKSSCCLEDISTKRARKKKGLKWNEEEKWKPRRVSWVHLVSRDSGHHAVQRQVPSYALMLTISCTLLVRCYDFFVKNHATRRQDKCYTQKRRGRHDSKYKEVEGRNQNQG